jgi:hypothetical protein
MLQLRALSAATGCTVEEIQTLIAADRVARNAAPAQEA